MDKWVKNTVMLAVTGVWLIIVLANWFTNHQLPDPVTWGIPGGVYFALNTSLPSRRREVPNSTTEVTDI